MVDFSLYNHGLKTNESSVDSVSVKVHILQGKEMIDRWPVLMWFYLKTLGLYQSGTLEKYQKVVLIAEYVAL